MSVRTIHVAEGRADYVTATLTEKDGKDLAGATLRLGLSTSSTEPPTVWHPCEVSYPTPGTAVLRLLVTAEIAAPGKWWVWADVVDEPTSQPVVAEGRLTTT